VEHGDGERIEMMALAIGVERVRDIQMRCLNTLAISNVLRHLKALAISDERVGDIQMMLTW